MYFVVDKNQWQKHGLATTMVDDNCALALYLMRIAVDDLGVKSISIEEIEALERYLGERLV